MKLRAIEAIEAHIRERRPERTRMRHVAIHDGPSHMMRDEMTINRIVDFRLTAGVRLTVEDNPRVIAEAHHEAARMLARTLFGDLREELLDLQEWVFEEGIGRDLETRVGRLIALVEGRDVEQGGSNEPESRK